MEITFLVTGVTGFLGKVVLEELIRCQSTTGFSKIFVLIRPTPILSAEDRFRLKVATSLCFSCLPKLWARKVEVISCNLSQPQCGIEDAVYTDLCTRVTHIIHCAGSVSFEADIQGQVADNVTSSLNILELARSCPRLQRLVTTSTAYVTPHTNDPIEEVLVPLPIAADALYDILLKGKTSADEIMRMTGHPNLYTLVKCLAEHLLTERKEAVSLTIVRPSIISVSWRYPFPGWVDSFAAYCGLVAGIGTGVLRLLSAVPDAVLDTVPVDEVARSLLEAVLIPKSNTELPQPPCIVHMVSTVKYGIEVGQGGAVAVEYFRHNSTHWQRKPKLCILGSNRDTVRFKLHDAAHHRLPLGVAKTSAVVRGHKNQVRRLKRARDLQTSANTVFQAFTHHTYDFQAAKQSLSPDFDRDVYSELICRGVQMYLL